MPDVLSDAHRANYDDAIEIVCNDVGAELAGVATFAVDRNWDGTPTGARDPLPIRVYILDTDGELHGEAGRAFTAWLDLEGAADLRDAIDAAIIQVELTRDQRRRSDG